MGKRDKANNGVAPQLDKERGSRKRKRHEKHAITTPAAEVDGALSEHDEGAVTKKPKKEKKLKKNKKLGEDTGALGTTGSPDVGTLEAEESHHHKGRKMDGEDGIVSASMGDAAVEMSPVIAPIENKRSKEERKKEKKRKRQSKAEAKAGLSGVTSGEKTPRSNEVEHSPAKEAEAAAAAADGADVPSAAEEDAEQKKKHRFIAFIGNLPYSTTTASMRTHFASVHPISVRHISQKPDDTNKATPKPKPSKKSSDGAQQQEGPSKGYAFLEFDSYERMETCLRTFHHSVLGGRRINVELTAGGGGSTPARREKLWTKNAKLHEERHKRRVKEEEQRLNPNAQGGEQKKRKSRKGEGGEGTAAAEDGDGGETAIGNGDIHPSRRARVQGR